MVYSATVDQERKRRDSRSADGARLPDPELLIKAAHSAQKLVGGLMEQRPNPDSVTTTLTALITLAEDLSESGKESEPHPHPIACKEGCSACCYMRVHVTPLEVIYLAQHITRELSREGIQALKVRVEKADSLTHGMSDEEYGYLGVACPLLENNRCITYEARPLECRAYVSSDVDACKRALRDYMTWNVPIDYSRYAIFKSVQAGTITGMADTERGYDLLELNAALKIALDNSGVCEQWLSGEPVFETASISPLDPEVQAFLPWTPTFGISS